MALLLALDVSSSVDAAEDQLQRQGLARALQSDAVHDAIFSSPDPVALAVFEWSGRYNQATLLPWTILDTEIAVTTAAAKIAGTTRGHDDFPTALGYALGYATTKFATAPACLFQTLDVSGDGENNDGFGPKEAFAAFPFDGITVNGLAIETAGAGQSSSLVQYYQNKVMHGPGAFIEIADGFPDFENAMRRKLVREMAAQIIGAIPTPGEPGG